MRSLVYPILIPTFATTMQFVDLPPDIYTDLIQYLSPADTLSLFSTCKALAGYLNDQTYKIIYSHLFPREPIVYNIPLQHGWLYYLNLRKRGHLYTWGESLRARLGYASTDSVFPARNGPLRGVPIPLNVQSLNNWSIRLIHSTGFSFITLLQPDVDTKAQLYYTGYQWRDTPYSQSSVPPGPNERDVITTTSAPNTRLPAMISLPGYHPMNLTYPRDNTTNYHTPETAYLSPLMITGDDIGGKSDSESNIRKLDPLIQVECGRQHVMGMSGQGRIWVWDAGIPGHCAVELDIAKVIKSFSGGKLLRATKIRCSWNANSCYVPGLGIIVWNGRESVTEEGIKKVEFGQWAQLVPNTQYVKDYACVFEDIVYIDSMGRNINHYHEGKTEAISSVGLDLLSPHKEDVKLDQDEEEYSRLLACYDKFIATTTYSRTVVYNVREKSGVTIELPVEAAPLVDIAMGDYHYLALAADGELYAWGHESRGCGCLGVEAQRTNQDLSIPKPKLVQKPVPGKWLAVTAGGWQSAGIFVEDD